MTGCFRCVFCNNSFTSSGENGKRRLHVGWIGCRGGGGGAGRSLVTGGEDNDITKSI